MKIPCEKIVSILLAVTIATTQTALGEALPNSEILQNTQPVSPMTQDSSIDPDLNASAADTSQDFLAGSQTLSSVSLPSEEEKLMEKLKAAKQGEQWRAEIHNGQVQRVSNSSGRLENAVFNSAGVLVQGIHIDAKGDQFKIEEGQLKEILRFNGTKETYENGYLIRIQDAAGQVKSYARTFSPEGKAESLTIYEGEIPVLPPASILYEQYNSSASVSELASSNYYDGHLQSVRFDQATALKDVDFWITRVLDPQGFVTARVYEDNNGSVGALVSVSSKRNVNEFLRADSNAFSKGSWQKFQFDEEVALQAGKSYWISLSIESGYGTYGSSKNYIAVYRDTSASYSNGQSARLKSSGSLELKSGDLVMKVNGYPGGVPGPARQKYQVNQSGDLINSDGMVITTAVTGAKTGFTLPQSRPEAIQSLSKSFQDLSAQPLHLLSSAAVEERNTALVVQMDGEQFSLPVILTAGWNKALVSYTDEFGNGYQISWDIYSDTFPPNVQQISGPVSHASKTELAYTQDGVLKKETVYLKVGRNVLVRELANRWGVTRQEFVIDYQPVLEDGTILRYRNGILTEMERSGLLIQNIVLTDQGALLSASIVNSAGQRVEIRNGKVIEIHFPDGKLRQFENGLIYKEIRPEELPFLYSRLFGQGGMTESLKVQIGEDLVIPPPSEVMSFISSASDSQPVGGSDAYTSRLQSVKFNAKTDITSLDFWLARVGDPSGSISVKIFEDNSSKPGKLIGASRLRDVREFPKAASNSYSKGQWQKFSFDSIVSLEAGKTYWVAITVMEPYPSIGSGSHYVTVYRNPDGGYGSGQAGRMKSSGTFELRGGDMNMRIEGYAGGIPKRDLYEYKVKTEGGLQNLSGQDVTSPYVPYAEGYTVVTDVMSQIQREGIELQSLIDKAALYRFPPEPPLVKLLSVPITNQNQYQLRYESGGIITEKVIPLSEGENRVQVEVSDDLGQTIAADFWITLDTTAPVLELISAQVTHRGQYKLRYLADGFLQEENMVLQKGNNQIIREVKDAAGNLARQIFVIQYLPYFQEPEAIYDEWNHLTSIRDSLSGTSIEYQSNAPYNLLIRNQDGSLHEAIFNSYEQANLEEYLAVTLANGLKTFYEGEVLKGIRLVDGTELQEVQRDAEGNIEQALIFYPDGRVEIIRFGKMIRTIEKNGTLLDFSLSGKPAREITEGGTGYFVYITGSNGEILQTIHQKPDGSFWTYNAEGRLSRIDYADGAYTQFENGMLQDFRSGSGKHYVYEALTGSDGLSLKRINYSQSSAPEDQTPVEFLYNQSGDLMQAAFWNGSRIYLENRKIVNVLDAQGNPTSFSYLQNHGFLNGLTVTTGDAQLSYDAEGFLHQIVTDTGTVFREKQTPAGLDEGANLILEMAGGNLLKDFELDSEGKIIRGIIETREGIKQKIENGILSGFTTSDGKIYDFQNNEATLREWQFQDGTRILYDGTGITEILFPDGKRLHTIGWNADHKPESFTEELPDGTKKYFLGAKLVRRVTPQGAEIHYGLDGLASRIFLPDGSEEILSYERSETGEIEKIIFESDFSRRVYRADGSLEALLDRGVQAEFEGGEISRIFTRFGSVNQPAFNLQGLMSGTIDFTDGSRQVLENGELKETIYTDGTRVHYQDGFINQITAAEGHYRIFRSAHPVTGLMDMTLRFEPLEDPSQFTASPLIPYLLAHPDSTAAKILMARPLYDSLADRGDISSLLNVSGAGHEIFFAKLYEDSQRANVYQLNGGYSPVWDDVSLDIVNRNEGYIVRNVTLGAGGSNDHLPALTADLIDINGDGLNDRVYMDLGTDPDWWWVQMNNGQSFEPAVKWTGVDRLYDPGAWTGHKYNLGALRHYEGRHPVVLGDFLDMNGDGLPDRVLQKHDGSSKWYIQINNGHGFNPVVEWGGSVQPGSQWSVQAEYASEVRDDLNSKSVQELIVDLVDMDGDGLPDRVVRPWTGDLTMWFFQKNNSHGFEDTVSWKGVDNSFYPGDAKMGASLSWYFRDAGSLIGDLSDLIDINGDGRPDRLLLKNKNPADANSAQDWYVQWNNGKGFDAAVLWDSDVRVLPGAATAKSGTSLRVFDGWDNPRNLLADLVDVTGDGRPDRVSLDQHNSNAQRTWWVEVNNGQGFAPAVAWTGIEGATAQETSLGQDNRNFRSTSDGDRSPSTVQTVSKLTDMNGDQIPDHVIFSAGQDSWRVQFGTGSGFLPAQTMKIESLQSSAVQNSSKYDYLHVSLRAESPVPSSAGEVRVWMENPQDPESQQEWQIADLGSDWRDFYLPLNPSKGNASEIHVEFLPAAAGVQIPVYVDNMTFTALRPSAGKDWLDRLLTGESVLSEVQSQRTQTLASYLGMREADQQAFALNWDQLLTAETRIVFNEQGQVNQFETLYGSVAKVQDGRVVETRLTGADGKTTVIEFSAPDVNSPQTTTQKIIRPDMSVETLALTYGKVRTVTRSSGSPLSYAYEFDAQGNEITVVYDHDAAIYERYRDHFMISRTRENGLVTEFEYDLQGELVTSRMTYKGKALQSYQHTQAANGNKILTTEQGIKEEYSPEGKILFHTTPEGFRFAHTFENEQKVETVIHQEIVDLGNGETLAVDVPYVTLKDDPEGRQVHRVSLESYYNREKEVSASYDFGELKSLFLKDKTRILFERVTVEEITDPAAGDTSLDYKLQDALVFHPDGTVTEFRDGKPFSITSAAGRVISLAKESGLLNHPQESVQFHFEQAEKLFQGTVIPQWAQYQPPSSLAVRTEYSLEGQMLTRRYAEGVLEIYENGKIAQVVGQNGERLIHYEYDTEGNPVHISMEGSRRKLESGVLKLQAQVALEEEEALARIADREHVLNVTIEGEYHVMRDRLIRVRQKIETQRAYVSSLKVAGKQAAGILGEAMAKIDAALNQVNMALRKLAKDRSAALTQLSAKVAEAYAGVELEVSAAYGDIEAEKEKVESGILKQEITPIVYHWYRKILGRDPSRAEYDAVIAQADYGTGVFDLTGLKQNLLNSQELQTRSTEVAAIKSAVKEALDAYLLKSEGEKLAFAQSLGILPEEQVSLSSQEISSIKTWIDRQGLHFGQSAYIALEKLLADAGVAYARQDIARDLILIDILTGTLTPLEKDDLVLSLYAMRKVAKIYNLNLSAFKMNFDTLRAMFDEACAEARLNNEACNFRLVVHINGNHYVVITGIDRVQRLDEQGNPVLDQNNQPVYDETVTYTDPGAGPENALEVVKVTTAEFLKSWQIPGGPDVGFGYVLSPRAPPLPLGLQGPGGNVLEAPASSARWRVLTTREEMSVRGAFFPFLIPIFIAIAHAIIAAVSAAISAIATVIATIMSGISAIASGVGSFFSGILSGNFLSGLGSLFQGIATGIGKIAVSVFHGIVQFGNTFHATFSALQAGLMSPVQAALINIPVFGVEMSTFASGSFISNAFNFGFGSFLFSGGLTVLEKIGISPKISQSFVSGGKIVAGIALLATGNPMGLGFIAGGTSEMLSLHTSLPPLVNQMIGISAAALGAFAGGGFNTGSFTGALTGLKSVLPQLSMDFATTGFTALGEMIGLNSQVASLVGSGLGHFTGNFVGSFSGNVVGYRSDGSQIIVSNSFDKGSFFGALQDALDGTISQVGMSFGDGLPSGLLGNLSSASIMKSVESLLGHDGLFVSIFDVLKQTALSPFNAVSSIVQNFTKLDDLILEKGFAKTMEGFATSIFSSQTLENLLPLGGISNLLSNAARVATPLITGQQGFETKLNNSTSLFFDALGNFIGKKEGGTTQIGKFGLNALGQFGLITGQFVSSLFGDFVFAGEISNGQWKSGGLAGAGGFVAEFTPEGGQGPIILKGPDDSPSASDGSFWNMVFRIVGMGFDFLFDKGKLSKIDVSNSTRTIPSFSTPAEESTDINKDLFVVTNGISNWSNVADDYLRNLQIDLFNASRNLNGQEEIDPIRDVIVAPSFTPSQLFLNFLKANFGGSAFAKLLNIMNDIMNLINEQRTGLQSLAGQVKSAMEAFFEVYGAADRDRPIIGVGYSGGFVPVVEAITYGNYPYKVNAYVALGGATLAIGAEAAKWLVKTIESFENVISARTEEARETYKQAFGAMAKAFSLMGPIGSLAATFAAVSEQFIGVLDEAYKLLGQGSVNAAANAFYTSLEKFVQSLSGFGWGMPGTVDAKMMVNIYGTKDLLATKTSIAGYRTEWAGFSTTNINKPLINIEIEGADHFDYIRGVDPNKTGDARTRNLIISHYVSEIILNSDDPDKLKLYMVDLISKQRAELTGTNTYKLKNLW